jgi:release factor glutamine methyltransferase
VPETGVRVSTLLDAAATRLRAAGVEDPRREAWRIWSDLEERAGRKANPAERGTQTAAGGVADGFEAAVARRQAGEPLAYVTGLAGFRRLTLRVDRRGLIPRPETEGLVELVLTRAPGGRVADVGTGCGCIALALADEGRYDLVLGLERSPAARELAAENRRYTGRAIQLLGGDLLESVGDGSLDAVVSNPPYLTEAEYRDLSPSVREWEPKAALASGADGLNATRLVITQALRATRPGGWLALEVDTNRAEMVAGLAAGAGWSAVPVYMDLFDRARFVLARRSEAE